LVRYAWPVASIREPIKRILPASVLDAYRRRRALRRYLRALSYEIHDRNRTYPLEQLEGKLLARRPDLTKRLMHDLLMRSDLLVQELDRQLEGVRSRHGSQLAELRHELEALRASLEALRHEVRDPAPTESPTGSPIID
jgi:DNA repair exonuclease SbcCD ATPase subunit